MSDVKKSVMSGDWQTGKGAIQDLGFVPTNPEIVKMQLAKIDFSDIEEGSPINICDLTGGTGEQLYTMYKEIQKSSLVPIAYYNELNSNRYDETIRSYGNLENWNSCNSNFFYLKARHKDGKSYKKDIFHIIRNNPPYAFIEDRGITVRAEETFFLGNAALNAVGGIQIFELPLHQLIGIKGLLAKIVARYDDLHIFKFPENEFKKYKQITVIGVKKKQLNQNQALVDEWYHKLNNELIPYLDADNESVIKLSNKTVKSFKEVNVFRDGRVNSETLSSGYRSVITDLWDSVRKSESKDKLRADTDTKSIIELGLGHIALKLNAGSFNGIKGDVLIKGGFEKETVSQVVIEDSKETTVYTEVIRPTIAITNRNGDILIKGAE